MQLEGARAAVGKRENGAVFQMGRAVALKPWTFNARGATVLDEEVAGLHIWRVSINREDVAVLDSMGTLRVIVYPTPDRDAWVESECAHYSKSVYRQS